MNIGIGNESAQFHSRKHKWDFRYSMVLHIYYTLKKSLEAMFYLREVGCNQGLDSSMVVLLPEPFTNHILQVKAYNNKQVFSEHALIVYKKFCFSVDEKFKLKVNYLLIIKILRVTRFKDPKAAILTLKMLTGSRL
jgi:hypothetical protein